MATLYYRKDESITALFDKISESPDSEIEVQCAPDASIWQNTENKAIIESYAARVGKTVRLVKQPTGALPPEEPSAEATSEANLLTSIEKSEKRKTGVNKWFVYPRILFVLLVLFLVIGGSTIAAAVYYLPRAEVQLIVAKQTVSEQTTVTLRGEQEVVDRESMSIPAAQVQVVKELSREFETTGTKTVGETATGSIVVYNWTEVSVQIPLGHKFKVNAGQQGAGLEFVSKAQVVVPPREEVTQGLGEKSTTAGSATVAVEAAEHGATYNLGANLFFTLDGYEYGDSGLQGINPNAFSGGTTEEVRIVAQSDIDTGRSELQETLEAAAREEIGDKAGESAKLVTESIKTEIVSNEFDKGVGEEATAITGRMTVRVTAQVYDEEKLKSLVSDSLSDNIPEGFDLAPEDMLLTVTFSGTSPEGFNQLSVRAEALVLPNLDEQRIREALAGVTTEEAQRIIQGYERVSQGNVTIHPKILAFTQRLPFRSDRISISIEEE